MESGGTEMRWKMRFVHETEADDRHLAQVMSEILGGIRFEFEAASVISWPQIEQT